MNDIGFLKTLEDVILRRIEKTPESSYTADLVAGGRKRMAQKVGEEGVELALAAVAGDREETLSEAADLVYHLLVLINSQGLRLADVVARLEARHQQ